MLYWVTSLAFDPDARKAYYTDDNYAFRDLMEVDVDTGKKRMLLRDARIGDLVLNPTDKSIWGIRHQNGFVTIVRIPPPYAGFNQIHTFDYGQTPVRPRHLARRHRWSRPAIGEINGDQSVRVWKSTSFEDRRGRDEVARLDCRRRRPEGFIFSPDGKIALRHVLLHRRLEHLPLRHRHPEDEAVSNASTGFFRPIPQPDGWLLVYEYTGEGLQPVADQAQATEDLGTVEFLGTRVVKTHPELKTWGVGSPAKVAARLS